MKRSLAFLLLGNYQQVMVSWFYVFEFKGDE